MASFSFNANQVPDGPDMSPITPGDYAAMIVDSGLDRKENGTEQIKITFKMTGGPFDGRQLSQWYTVRCQNQQAVDIGMRQLKIVCESVGMPGFRDTQELHGKPLLLKVGERKNEPAGKVYADVKGCKPLVGTSRPVAPVQAPVAAAPQPAANTAVPTFTPPAKAAPSNKPWLN